MGILQAILQVMLQGAGPVVYYLKVLKAVVSAGCYAYRAFGVLLLGPRSWARRLPRLVRELWLGVLRMFRGRVCAGGAPRFEDILFKRLGETRG